MGSRLSGGPITTHAQQHRDYYQQYDCADNEGDDPRQNVEIGRRAEAAGSFVLSDYRDGDVPFVHAAGVFGNALVFAPVAVCDGIDGQIAPDQVFVGALGGAVLLLVLAGVFVDDAAVGYPVNVGYRVALHLNTCSTNQSFLPRIPR